MTAISFLPPSLCLIHIPAALFPHCFHGVLSLCAACPAFFNLSLTPESISIICPEEEADRLFAPVIARLGDAGASIEKERYFAMQIDGEGISEGRKLLELTQPLARAGVSILFITTYFSDYVLVAAEAVQRVKQVLLETEYAFEDLSQSYVSHSSAPSRFSSPILTTAGRSRATSRAADEVLQSLDDDLETDHEARLKESVDSLTLNPGISTLDFLRQCQVPVSLYKSVKLVMTGLRGPFADCLQTLTEVLLRPELPMFFSLTIAPDTPPSLLLEPTLAETFGGSNNLLGIEADQTLVPITLDLRGLASKGEGLGGCGIICGVVEELLKRVAESRAKTAEEKPSADADVLVMSYLSTVVTGNVLLLAEDLDSVGSDSDCRMM